MDVVWTDVHFPELMQSIELHQQSFAEEDNFFAGNVRISDLGDDLQATNFPSEKDSSTYRRYAGAAKLFYACSGLLSHVHSIRNNHPSPAGGSRAVHHIDKDIFLKMETHLAMLALDCVDLNNRNVVWSGGVLNKSSIQRYLDFLNNWISLYKELECALHTLRI